MAFPLLLAFGGGIVSFASPCVLPLVPVYLSLVTGFDISAPAARDRTGVILRDTALFVAGFTLVFVLLGTTASVVGQALMVNHLVLTRIAGGTIVVMAAVLAGAQFGVLPRFYGEWRPHVQPRHWGPIAAPVAGAAFGFGWTPCIGPILASVLTIAATQGKGGQGAALLAAYSLGLGVPFIAGGLLLGRLTRLLAWLRRRARAVTVVSAALMVVLGVLLISGQLSLIDTAMGGL